MDSVPKDISYECHISLFEVKVILLAAVTLVAMTALTAYATAGNPNAWVAWTYYGVFAAPIAGMCLYALCSSIQKVPVN